MSSQHTSQHELDWLAYRYVSGELSASDAEQFEAMLLDSQPAREAVARAVELMEVIGAAAPFAVGPSLVQPVAANPVAATVEKSVADSTRSWLRVAGWLSLATAASLALLLFGLPDRRPEVALVAKPVAAPTLDELTAAWIASRPEATSEDVSEGGDDAALDELSAEGDAAADDAEFAAPSWLMAAVTGSSTQPGQIAPNQGTQE